MPTHSERVLEYLASFPGRDDDEIAKALDVSPRQTINIVCRKLCQNGLIRRERGPLGKLVNYLVEAMPSKKVAAEPLVVITGAVPSSRMTEDQVKAALAKWLETAGWQTQIAWGRNRGIDITAVRGGERWIIECKGSGSSAPMRNNYFLGVIGEVLQRMKDDEAKHSIAFPDLPKFRRLWSELHSSVKLRLHLTALFVSADELVAEVA